MKEVNVGDVEIVQMRKLGIGSKTHALISVVFMLDGRPSETWILFSGQEDGIEVGRACAIDRSLSNLTWLPLINAARKYLHETQDPR